MKNNYTIYKNRLREEFFYTCVYCGIREPELGGVKSFHIDHYRPQNKFPHLISQYNNLLYACRDCNSHKSDYWPTPVERMLGHIVLNPRNHKIEVHIDKSNFSWKGKTSKGRWNVKRFRLDTDLRVKQRQDRKNIEATIEQLEKMRNEACRELISIKKQDQSHRKLELEQYINEQKDRIISLQRKIIGPID